MIKTVHDLHVPYPEIGAVLGPRGDEVAAVGAPRQVRHAVRVPVQGLPVTR